ncbi:MAG: AEC family transporter [Minwuia sp.]|uniref:AEC family transporter n=1 Tax=Minwuia sp. TaxID=2493630 RepID=UPI003A854E91
MEPILNIVLPVFAIVAAGYACGAGKVLGEESSAALNGFVYWVALPAMLFRAMATVEVAQLWQPDFLIGFLTPLLAIWLAAIVAARFLFRRTLAEAAIHGMNGVYGNSGYMGIPLAVAAFGEAAAVPAVVATVINTAVVVGIAVGLIEAGSKTGNGGFQVLVNILRRMARNPMLIAPLLGLAWAFTGLDLPVPLDSFTGILGSAAGPCALFAIGLFMVGKPRSEGRMEVGVMTAVKLIGQPAGTALAFFWLLPVDPLWAKVAVLMAALPTGAGSFVLAQAYGIYVLRTSSAILLGTVLSVVTISIYFIVFPPIVGG